MPEKNFQAIAELIRKECPRHECSFRPANNDVGIVCFGCSWFRKRNVDYSLLVSTTDSARTERLVFVGSGVKKSYTGDGIDAQQGQVVAVSAQKKAQLLGDFPDEWKEVNEVKKPEPKGTKKSGGKKKGSKKNTKKATGKK